MLTAEEKRVAAYVIRLISSVVNGTVPPKIQDDDWGRIIAFAKKQSVLNIVAYAAETSEEKPDELTLKFLKEFRMQKMLVEAQQELAACDACEKLDEMSVRHMLLKGSVMKNYYPSPDMRTMGDIDILIDSSRCDEVVDAFVADGFEFVDEGDLHSNIKKGNTYIELHHSMIDKNHEVLSKYYGDGFLRAKKSGNGEYEYKLSEEDFYVFLVAHIAKHYRYGGLGIRFLLDLYVYENAVPTLDLDYVRGELEKVGLLEFYEKIRKITFDWYSGNFDGEFNIMSEYIVSGGIYGIEGTEMQNSYIYDHLHEDFHFQKIRTVFKIVFLEYKEMKIRYPILQKRKFLLPLFWIVRFFDTMLHNPRNALQRLDDSKKIVSIDDEMVEIQRKSGIEKL